MRKSILLAVFLLSGIIALNTARAQSCDTLRNYNLTDNFYQFTGVEGYVLGHEKLNTGASPVTQYAEPYSVPAATEVRRLRFVPWKISDQGGSVVFTVYQNNAGTPGAILGTQTELLADMTQGAYNQVDFTTPVNVNGTFFVGFQLSYTSSPQDTFAITGTHKPGGTNYTQMFFDGTWQGVNTVYTIGTDPFISAWEMDVLCSTAPSPIADFTSNWTACLGGQFNVDASASQNVDQYVWILGDNPYTQTYDNGSGVTTSLSPTVSGGTQAIYLIADGGCQTDQQGYLVDVFDPITATVSTTNATCGNNNGAISVTGVTGGSGNYSYSVDGVNFQNSSNFTNLAPTTYTVYVVSGGNACQATYNVTVNATPQETITVGLDPTICAGNSTTINASGNGTIEWFEGTTSIGTGTSISVSPTATTTYQAVLTDANNCEDAGQITVNVNPLPTVSAGSDNSICIGSSYTISASGANTYNWDNGLGAGATHTVSPTATTTYEVTGTDGNGCQNTDQVVITVNQIDDASFTFNDFCEQATTNGPTNIALTGGTFSFNPTPGDGSTIDATTGEISNGVSGTTYSVEYTTNGPCPTSSTETVTVLTGDDPTFVYDDICLGNSLPIAPYNIATPGGTFSFATAPGDGATIDASTGEITNATQGSTYSVQYTTPSGVCQSTFTETVEVYNAPVVATSPDELICEGTTTSVSATGADTYNWDNGLGTGATHTVAPISSITYTVTGEDNLTGCTNTDNVTITVEQLPTVVAGTDETICEGDAATITAAGADTYSWDNGLGNGATHTVNPATSTTYTVTGASSNGCENTSQVTITVNALPVVEAGADQTACVNHDPITLTGTPTGGTFIGIGVTGNNFDPATAGTGTHQITYSFQDANGCEGTDVVEITVDGCASIFENDLSQGLTVMPNPATDYVNIITDEKIEIESIKLLTAEGRNVPVEIIKEGNTTRLDITTAEKGTYFIHMNTKAGSVIKKVIIH